MDFTLTAYQTLLQTLQSKNYQFSPFKDYIQSGKPSQARLCILRHDVDRLPRNALQMASLERSMGIHGTYYFRIVAQSYDFAVMQKIGEMGHEIGYHYEDLSLAAARSKIKESRLKTTDQTTSIRGNELIDMALTSFIQNLERFREHFDVKTICMHGGPLSRWDNRLLWQKYDYRAYGIIGEPYFDMDFSEVLYLTDTGRRWDGERVAIRDKVKSENLKGKNNFSYLRFHSTKDIIKAARDGKLPDKLMITTHPQRWTNRPIPWMRELLWQNIKNVGKWILVSRRAGRI